eukprot:CAMPEP_0118881218 /NCGR_PEP_ID=MMETSP1163-20130328/20715_1 /TAXON_ID=124430 /ORGANISM="Phaeomonas parva, Strain CCMP2877" /LENGTH=51 /DNA_ID=CAMNT_0006817925 /DNA_START=1 /DNA_END=156 /DNA_ORIENTATION=-
MVKPPGRKKPLPRQKTGLKPKVRKRRDAQNPSLALRLKLHLAPSTAATISK